ncbi:hypothetical protein [Nonomuraea fuscirosea]|uniref:hypothetical protein n=1 Tax=Nonomuraea fuscirosea TaxID=1291556 RepID=UPI00343FB720
MAVMLGVAVAERSGLPTAAITVVTERILACRAESLPVDPGAEEDDLGSLTCSPRGRGLRNALITLVVFLAAFKWTGIGEIIAVYGAPLAFTLLVWTLLFFLFRWLGIPLGPGAPIPS